MNTIIMGATSGIGYEVAKLLAQRGWRVGVAEVSKSETVAAAYDDMQKHIKETFDY